MIQLTSICPEYEYSGLFASSGTDAPPPEPKKGCRKHPFLRLTMSAGKKPDRLLLLRSLPFQDNNKCLANDMKVQF